MGGRVWGRGGRQSVGQKWEAECGADVGGRVWGRGGMQSVGQRWETECGAEVEVFSVIP